MPLPKTVLPLIVISQFCCTSLWFAGNGVMSDLVTTYGLEENALGHLTSAVQMGFIAGTLAFAVLTITDRFSPSKVFLVSAMLGATANASILWESHTLSSILLMRFLTGFFLAGIYPVGMKVAADHFDKGLGKSLGFLVGALVLGTAFPHLVKGIPELPSWRYVLIGTSTLAVIGGLLMGLLVPDGPHRRSSQRVELLAFLSVFQNKRFRMAAFGYFGHMWELYAFWAFVPVMLADFMTLHPDTTFQIPITTFLIIGVGGAACVAGGYLASSLGTQSTARLALLLSCTCCLISPWMIGLGLGWAFLVFLIFWGMVVIADSPLFSTLVAENAPADKKGTALTVVNCLGFAVTVISIQLLSSLRVWIDPQYLYTLLALGPIIGLILLRKKA